MPIWVLDRVQSFEVDQGGFDPAITNILLAGKPVVEVSEPGVSSRKLTESNQGILNNWDQTFSAGIAAQNGWLYNSDDLHTLTELRKREVKEFHDLRKRAVMRR